MSHMRRLVNNGHIHRQRGSNRQQIEALFLPTLTEIWSWEKATESGILDKDLVNNLRSV